MKVVALYDMNCDSCGCWASTDWGVSQFYNKKSCLKWAKKSGWKTVKGETHCLGCVLKPKIRKILEKKYKVTRLEFDGSNIEFSIVVEGNKSEVYADELKVVGLELKYFSTFSVKNISS
ncbi:hypothetical protein [Paenibacillus chitinolyticus]|uniref:DUF3795 domain-containing protein n=1 Tax=Paenibacillus chitinolyticus TaxID=79263 RepID=A0ABT4FRG2_9BACL|nr:hypothetical protein [Paenibacillus chitinolyticus]MCY9592383.1 hypothetical protein [Paenibacillus chitinolyticus]MCY9599844.1 hypothetical protein [Paenibacillus chitinolyticus]